MSRDENPPPETKKRRRGRKRFAALLILIIGLFWLNGPGWRWIGGFGLRRALDEAGLTADFELKGTLLGGIRVEQLSLSGGPIRKLEIGSLNPLYQLRRVIHGELDGVSVDHVDVVVDLAAPRLRPNKPAADLPAQLRRIRLLLLPLELRAADVRFQLVRGEESLVTLETSNLSHLANSDEFRLKLGDLAVGPGYAFSAQESIIRWTEETITLDRFDLTPRFGISDLRVEMPLGGGLSASAVARVEDSRVLVNGTQSSATVQLEGAPLVLQDAAKNFAIGLPLDATLRSFNANITGFDHTPDLWQVTATAELEDLNHEAWHADSISFNASKIGSTGNIAVTLAALGGELQGTTDLAWRDLASGAWSDFEATSRVSVPQVAPVFAELKSKLAFAPAEAPPLPSSSLTLDARIDSTRDGIRSAEAQWRLSPEKDAASVTGELKWTPEDKLGGTIGTDGLRTSYVIDLQAKRYEGSATLESFRPEHVAAWAAAAGVKLPTGMNATGTWQGSGDFGPQPHRGTFDIPSFEWVRKDGPPLILRTKGNYAWPREIALTDLTAIADGQTIHAEARLADKMLEIPRIEWLDGETRLVGGKAELPVPEHPIDLKEFLKQEIALNIFLESEWIDHSRLAAWLPARKSPLAEGSGRLRLVVTGTPAKPKINLEAALKGLRLPDQPDVPVTDATVTLDGADDTLVLAGEIKPAGYPPVTLAGRMPFKPGKWAEKPEIMLQEKLEARANIPRLDLATFSKLAPQVDKLAGRLEGFVTASGTIGKPELGGELRLSGGALSLKNSQAPRVSNATALVQLKGKEIGLESLSLESAGGTLTGKGTVGLADASKPTFDLVFRGDALPIKRDESKIVRADANLSLRGNLQQAGISGTVDIVDSLYYRDFEILPVRVPFTAPSRPKLPAIDSEEKAAAIPAPFSTWALDVLVRTRDPILIRGNLADGSAVGKVHIGGTLGDIQPDGQAIISNAEARLPFSTLKVDSGAVVFTPAGGLIPELNIRGTSSVGRYEVTVFFYGPANAPKTALTSDPPLPESEIMTLLATGTTSEGLENGQAATLKAVQLLLEEWRRGRLPYGEQVAKVLEVLNRVDVRIGEDDLLTGQRLNSATIEVTEKIFVSGSVDKQGNTRVLGAFVFRFK